LFTYQKKIRESRSLKEILNYKFAHSKKRIVKNRSRGKIVRNKHRKIRTARQSTIKRTIKGDKKREVKRKLIRKLKKITQRKKRENLEDKKENIENIEITFGQKKLKLITL